MKSIFRILIKWFTVSIVFFSVPVFGVPIQQTDNDIEYVSKNEIVINSSHPKSETKLLTLESTAENLADTKLWNKTQVSNVTIRIDKNEGNQVFTKKNVQSYYEC